MVITIRIKLKKCIKTAVFCLLLLLAGCSVKKEVQISGKTMGTTYHIKVVTWYFEDLADLKKKIDENL